jgi:hypothetical protein
MELCSMLAHEPFTDQPASACPILAAFVRGLNDHLRDADRQRLVALAPELLGTRSTGAVEGARFERVLALACELHATRTFRSPFGPRFKHVSQRLNAEVAGAHCGLAVRRDARLLDHVLVAVRRLVALDGRVRVPAVVDLAAVPAPRPGVRVAADAEPLTV